MVLCRIGLTMPCSTVSLGPKDLVLRGMSPVHGAWALLYFYLFFLQFSSVLLYFCLFSLQFSCLLPLAGLGSFNKARTGLLAN